MLAGGPLRFHQIEAVVRDETRECARAVIAVARAVAWAEAFGLAAVAKDLVQRLSAPRPPFAGLDLGRPQIMGVINVTPDSFSMAATASIRHGP